MPYVPVTLKALKPKEPDLEPSSLGDHLRKRRLKLALTQRKAARCLGVTAVTVLHWERGDTQPLVASMPGIIGFLGYNPFPEPKDLSERLLAKRRLMGWTIKEAAGRLGVDEGTWGEWEREGCIPWQRYRTVVETFLVQGSKEPGVDPPDCSAKSEKADGSP